MSRWPCGVFVEIIVVVSQRWVLRMVEVFRHMVYKRPGTRKQIHRSISVLLRPLLYLIGLSVQQQAVQTYFGMGIGASLL